MLKARLSSLLFAVLASLSMAATAAESPKTESAKPAAVQSAQVATVNLNTADAATLQKELAGIGATKAQAIVAYREEHGNFTSVDELLEVKGIGPATLEKNRDKLSVN
ncbi:helix-hairpin-helix domain-containing protein [Ectopseudomonas hydrolytica]|uniref:Helix-hairpin-helix domain-containing protein n=1 Tax=Ectopseudomonas hydrolytica TaxID=2493633 RepID=A0ABY5AF09_9GAMM|nr:helix-hairpin-helix domain-containing protein [Pseudomonas hydrolytica]USR41539.1 helix-hairpin-helix domain-containing protein [Pseudomonas hydrolytica]